MTEAVPKLPATDLAVPPTRQCVQNGEKWQWPGVVESRPYWPLRDTKTANPSAAVEGRRRGQEVRLPRQHSLLHGTGVTRPKSGLPPPTCGTTRRAAPNTGTQVAPRLIWPRHSLSAPNIGSVPASSIARAPVDTTAGGRTPISRAFFASNPLQK